MCRGRRRLATVVAVLLLPACAGSGFRYIENADDHVYFKVPDDWQLFDEDDVIRGGIANLEEEIAEGIRLRTWLRGFDAGPQPSPQTVLNRASAHPRGYGEVRLLSRIERDNISLAALRSWGFGFDPLDRAEQDPDGDIRLLHIEELSHDDGSHGVRLIVMMDGEDGQSSVVDQTVLVDAETTRLYRFTIGCSLACYQEHQDLLMEVAESWTLKEI